MGGRAVRQPIAVSCGLGALLVLAPLPFGSVQSRVTIALHLACLILAAAWIVWRTREGRAVLPWRDPVLWGAALILALGLLQLVPMPRSVLRMLSPTAIELRDAYEPASHDVADPAIATREGQWRPVSLYPWATRRALIGLAATALMALLALDVAADRSGRAILGGALLASGAFQALYGLAEDFSGRQHIFGYAKRLHTDAATGTYINPNHYAGLLEMTLPFVLVAATMACYPLLAPGGPSLRYRLARSSGRALFRTSMLLVLALTMFAALLRSQSRMGIVSLLAGLSLMGLYATWRGRSRSFAVITLLMMGSGLLLVSQGKVRPLVDQFLAAPRQMEAGLGRWSIWSQSADVAARFPVLGSGLGTFPHVMPAFQRTGEGRTLTHAHNDYLELAAEIGVAGSVIALCAVLLILGSLRTRSRDPAEPAPLSTYAAAAGLLAVAFHSLVDFNLAIPANALTFSVLVGVAISWRGLREPRRSMGSAGLAVAAMGLATLAWLTAAPLIPDRGSPVQSWGDRDNPDRWFQAAASIGDGAVADLQVIAAAGATGSAPSPEAVRYLGSLLDEAIRLQETGLRHWPLSARGHLDLALLRAARCSSLMEGAPEDCLSGALPGVRTALQLRPMSAALHLRAGRFLIAGWLYLDAVARTDARRIVVRAAELNPEEADLLEARERILGG